MQLLWLPLKKTALLNPLLDVLLEEKRDFKLEDIKKALKIAQDDLVEQKLKAYILREGLEIDLAQIDISSSSESSSSQ